MNFVAVAVGVALAGLPLLAADFWLRRMVEREGRLDVASMAGRALGLAEMRIGDAVRAIAELKLRNVGVCDAVSLPTMRYVVLRTPAIKEVSVLAGDGRTLCTQDGHQFSDRRAVVSEPLDGAAGFLIETVTIGGDLRMVRVRDKDSGVAAMIPAGMLLPIVSTDGGRFMAHAAMATAQGTGIVAIGPGPETFRPGTFYPVRQRSDRFGLIVDMLVPNEKWVSRQAEMRQLVMFAATVVAVIIFLVIMLRPRREVHDPVEDMRRAIANGEFIPYYQPVVDIRSGKLRGAEVLVRWRKPDGTVVPPGVFIPFAESSGLIREMTFALMKSVCAEAGEAIGSRRSMRISFNFPAGLFADDAVVAQVQRIFAKSPIKPSQVVLELTERDPIENFTETRRVIAAFQGLGMRIAIDDVGTGHAGLSYMLKLGVDIIKIDKMFVDALGADRNSNTIVETLVDLAHNMRMDIIAEGVETFEQVMHLRELGIRHAQGYVFAPPLPGGSFLQLVDAIEPEKAANAAEAAFGEPATAAAG